jgi:hypothetical protein
MKNKKLYVLGAITLVLTIITIITHSLWFFLLTIGAAIYTAYDTMTNPNTGEEEESHKEEESEDGINMDWESEVSTDEAYEYLLKVNFSLRVNGLALKDEQVASFENLIDDLRGLILQIEDSPSVLKWKVNQICVDFLPKLVRRFNVAPNGMRDEIMETTVKDINAKVNEIANAVETNNQEEFEFYANTLQQIMKS